MTDIVLCDVSERIATITLNRPEARNALSSEVLRLLPQRLREVDADDAVDVIILTGTDPAFCAGLDLKELGSTGANLGAGGAGGRGPVPGPGQADHRRRQRAGHHRRLRAGAGLRLPRGVRPGPLRRHPRPGRGDAGLGAHRAPAPGHRRPAGPGDELHGQLPHRRRGPAVGPGQPRRRPCRPAAVHPPPGPRHRVERPAGRAPDPLHLRRRGGDDRRRGLADRAA